MSNHLKDKNISFQSHFRFAYGAGIVLILAGVASIIHAILPNVLAEYSERKTKALARLARRRK